MRFTVPMKTAVATAACAFALVVAAGCSSGGSSSNSGSEGSSTEPAATSAVVQGTSADTSAAVQGTSADTSAPVQQSVAPVETSASVQGGVPEGYQVFEGTVLVATAEELIELQGIDIDPAAAGGGGTYAVLVFDAETAVTGQSADGSGERTEPATMLGIAEYTDYGNFVVEYGDLDVCKQLNGQHVALAASAEKIMFPSDVRFPIGEPSASEVIFL